MLIFYQQFLNLIWRPGGKDNEKVLQNWSFINKMQFSILPRTPLFWGVGSRRCSRIVSPTDIINNLPSDDARFLVKHFNLIILNSSFLFIPSDSMLCFTQSLHSVFACIYYEWFKTHTRIMWQIAQWPTAIIKFMPIFYQHIWWFILMTCQTIKSYFEPNIWGIAFILHLYYIFCVVVS